MVKLGNADTPNDVLLDFAPGAAVYTASTPGTVFMQDNGWVRIDYYDGTMVWYPSSAFRRIVRKPE